MTAKSKPNGSVRRRNIYRDANSSPQKKKIKYQLCNSGNFDCFTLVQEQLRMLKKLLLRQQ
jgi:hypothetical protein